MIQLKTLILFIFFIPFQAYNQANEKSLNAPLASFESLNHYLTNKLSTSTLDSISDILHSRFIEKPEKGPKIIALYLVEKNETLECYIDWIFYQSEIRDRTPELLLKHSKFNSPIAIYGLNEEDLDHGSNYLNILDSIARSHLPSEDLITLHSYNVGYLKFRRGSLKHFKRKLSKKELGKFNDLK